jgi:hypothetical protein
MFNLTVGHGSLLKFIPEIYFLPEQTKEIKKKLSDGILNTIKIK